jgi:hypothetical protein
MRHGTLRWIVTCGNPGNGRGPSCAIETPSRSDRRPLPVRRIRTSEKSVNAEPVPTSRHDTLARLVQNARCHAIPLSCKGRLMIVAQPETEVREVAVSFCSDVRLPLILTISDEAPVRFPFVHVHRP